MNYSDLFAWLGLGTDGERRFLVELCRDWEIFRPEDIRAAIAAFESDIQAIFNKPLLVEQFRNLFALKYPFSPRQRVFTISRSTGAVDNFNEPVESLIRQGFELDYVSFDGNIYHWEEHFSLELVSKHLDLPDYFNRENSHSRLGNATTPAMGEDVREGPSGISRKEFRSIVKAAERKDAFSPRIRWFDLKSAPPTGSSLELHLTYGGEDEDRDSRNYKDGHSRGKSDDLDVKRPEGPFRTKKSGGLDLNKSTGWISPLSRPLLTSKQILQPAEEWDTFIKYRVADRVDTFVRVPDTKLLFRDSIVVANASLRWTAEEIAAQKPDGFFIPYTPKWQRPIHESELRLLWRLIKVEQLLAEGWRSRAVSEKTARERKILDEISSEVGTVDYKLAAEDALLHEMRTGDSEGFADDLAIPAEEIRRKAEQMRDRDRYHRRKDELSGMAID